jgi:hypothetical protein
MREQVSPDTREAPGPCELIPACPVCLFSPMAFEKETEELDICVCPNCGMRLSVPHDAWEKRPKTV